MRADLAAYATELGLGTDVEVPRAFGVHRRRDAWIWPMFDADRKRIGARLRLDSGRKLSEKGGRNGLFLPGPTLWKGYGPLAVGEGETDTAHIAALRGLDVVGRPGCTSCTDELCRLAVGRTSAVIVSDDDRAGLEGAWSLARAMASTVGLVVVVLPPHGFKDAREWLTARRHAGRTAAQCTDELLELVERAFESGFCVDRVEVSRG
ncbi:MAG: hypothetical protein KDB80_03675 [Planctomycetes bacterium]|nr:hypothetical protein [Planctomycetota bacterium]